MPPEKIHKPLSKAEIETLQRWIAEGAPYEKQWIYEPPVRVTPPKIDSLTFDHPINAFIQDRLAEQSGSPTPEAERMRLIRRVAFDLTGLPPTPEEVHAFVERRFTRCLRETCRSTPQFDRPR